MDEYLRYVSVCGLVVSNDRNRLLVGNRSRDDEFCPGDFVFPSGRAEGNEGVLDRLYLEIARETGVAVSQDNSVYLGDCCFEREGFPVTQLCFGVIALPSARISPETPELDNLRFVTVREFHDIVPEMLYQQHLVRFVKTAERMGLLVQ